MDILRSGSCLVIVLLACISANSLPFCVDKEFDYNKFLCCGNKLHPQSGSTRCCQASGEVYDAFKQICCGKVMNVDSPGSMECCKTGNGVVPYDARLKTCCNGHLHNTTREMVFPGGFRDTEKIRGFCCGNDFIDSTAYGNGVFMQCCESKYPLYSKPYNYFTGMCCGGHVHARVDKNLQCCGTDTYDLSSHICCRENGKDKIRNRVDNSLNVCCEKAPGGVISKQTHVCESGKPKERECFEDSPTNPEIGCCRYMQYNKTTHHCCARNLLPMETQCCAGLAMLPGEVCCGSVHGPVNVTGKPHNACCYTKVAFNTFNSTTQECRIDGTVSEKTICGKQAYDPKSNICCNGKLQPRLPNYECCGNRLYPPAYLTCCNGHRIQGKSKTCNL